MEPRPAAPRTCGTCTLCCKALAVFELDKPTGEWCPHCAQGASAGGCGVYATRPPECASFACLWLRGQLPEEDRPDRLHGVLYWHVGDVPDGRPVVDVAESYPGAADRNRRLAAIVADLLRRGYGVMVRNAEYVEYRRPGIAPMRRPINTALRLRVLPVGADPAAYEARMRANLERMRRP